MFYQIVKKIYDGSFTFGDATFLFDKQISRIVMSSTPPPPPPPKKTLGFVGLKLSVILYAWAALYISLSKNCVHLPVPSVNAIICQIKSCALCGHSNFVRMFL